MNIFGAIILALSLALNLFLAGMLDAAIKDRNYYHESNNETTEFNLHLLDRINYLKRNLSMLRASLNKIKHKTTK